MQGRVAGEDAHGRTGEQFGDDETHDAHEGGPAGGLDIHFPDAGVLPGAEVVAGDRLHALVEAHDDHHEQEADAVHDAVGAERQVAAPLDELLVDEQHDDAAGEVHQERAHADGQGILGDAPVDPEDLPAAGEVEELLLVQEEPHRVAKGHELAQDGGERRSPDAHAQREDEDRVQDGVGDDREQGEAHGNLGIAGGPDDTVQAEVQVRDRIAQGDDDHVVPGVGQRVVAGAEKPKDRVHPEEGHDGEDDAGEDIQGDLVGEDLVCDRIVLLAQQDGNHRRGAYAHQSAERRGDVHQGEGDREAGDGERAHIGDMPDVDAVHHVIQRRGGHGDDAGNRVLPDKLTDGLGAQFDRNGARHGLRLRDQVHVKP